MSTARAKDIRALAAAGFAGLLALALIGCSGGQTGTPAKATAQTAKPGTEQSTTPEATSGTAGAASETPAAAVETPQGAQPTVEIKAVDESGHVVMLEMKTIYFDFDKYDIRADQKPAVDFNAAELKKFPNLHVVIEGHCDERGTTEYNLALGQRRAVAVLTALEGEAVAKDRMKTISYGKERPAVAGHDEAAWSKNRRGQFRTS